MTKTFCERCGKEIKKKYGCIIHMQLYASMSFLQGKEHTEWYELPNRCICLKCEDSYIHWFMNPETGNDNGELAEYGADGERKNDDD